MSMAEVNAPAGEEAFRSGRVLIVDDHADAREAISGILSIQGIENIEYAGDGQEALDKLRAFLPDLIILDISMPGMNGIEFLQKIRSSGRYATIPVLVQTAHASSVDRTAVFKAGATDFVKKPIDVQEFIDRVEAQLRGQFQAKKLHDRSRHIIAEFATARNMQEGLIPGPAKLRELEKKYRFRINHRFEPCAQLGGDFWGIRAIDESRFCLFAVDFSGHGVVAAMNTIRLHTILEEEGQSGGDPAGMLNRLNTVLSRLLPRGQFATAIWATIDIDKRTLIYSSAGAPAAFVGFPQEDEIRICDTTGMPLGIDPTVAYANRAQDFPEGSFLFLYSDVLMEAENPAGQILDDVGVASLVQRNIEKMKHADGVNAVMREFFEMTAGRLPDDLTAIQLVA